MDDLQPHVILIITSIFCERRQAYLMYTRTKVHTINITRATFEHTQHQGTASSPTAPPSYGLTQRPSWELEATTKQAVMLRACFIDPMLVS